MTTLTHSKPAKVFGGVVTTPHQRLCSSYLGGLLLGLVLFAAFFFTGNGLGASGGLNRYIVFVEDLIAPQHVDRTPYLLKLAGGSKDPLDDWVVFMVAGAMIGGFTSGWLNGRLKIETNKGPNISVRQRWFLAFSAAPSWIRRRMARAALGLALSGGAVLSAGAWAFMFSVLAVRTCLLILCARHGYNRPTYAP